MLMKIDFYNYTSGELRVLLGPDITSIQCDHDSVENILEWYGAFYAGDDYSVFINGTKRDIDMNGELDRPTIDAE